MTGTAENWRFSQIPRKEPRSGKLRKVSIDSEEAKSIVSEAQFAQLEEEIELLDGASAEFDQEMVSKGELSPVFFGSALTNFGVETFLQHFLKMTTSPHSENCPTKD